MAYLQNNSARQISFELITSSEIDPLTRVAPSKRFRLIPGALPEEVSPDELRKLREIPLFEKCEDDGLIHVMTGQTKKRKQEADSNLTE